MSNIKAYSIRDLLSRIENRDYFRFPKLLHGFWDRLDFFSYGKYDINCVVNNIRNFGENFGDKIYSEPLVNMQFFEERGTVGIGLHYIEIIELLAKSNPNVLWGISDTNFHGDSQKSRSSNLRKISKKWIDLTVKANMVDGCFWKDLVSSGEFVRFLNAIEKFAVVVIGMKHLAELNDVFCFQDFHFIEVEMPLAPRLQQFQKELEKFQAKLCRPAVYMSQMSIDGVPLICKADLSETFFFDVGRGLDAFSKISIEREWEETIPASLRTMYKNECFRKKLRSQMLL